MRKDLRDRRWLGEIREGSQRRRKGLDDDGCWRDEEMIWRNEGKVLKNDEKLEEIRRSL